MGDNYADKLEARINNTKNFRDFLFYLASSTCDVESHLQKIKKLIQAIFPLEIKSYYSEIAYVLTQITNNESENTSIEDLQTHLSALLDILYSQTNIFDSKTSNFILELSQIIKHDVALLNYIGVNNYNISLDPNFNEIEKTTASQTIMLRQNAQEIKDINDQITTIKNKILYQEREYIAILGIFAAVVLTFAGIFELSWAVLNNMTRMQILDMLLIFDAAGLVFCNLIYGLLYYLSKIVYDKDINIRPLYISNLSFLGLFFLITLFKAAILHRIFPLWH